MTPNNHTALQDIHRLFSESKGNLWRMVAEAIERGQQIARDLAATRKTRGGAVCRSRARASRSTARHLSTLCDGWSPMLRKKHRGPTVTKRAQAILCNPLVPKLARVAPNYCDRGTKKFTPWYQKVYPLVPKLAELVPNPAGAKVVRWCQIQS